MLVEIIKSKQLLNVERSPFLFSSSAPFLAQLLNVLWRNPFINSRSLRGYVTYNSVFSFIIYTSSLFTKTHENHLVYVVLKKLIFLKHFNLFRWPNPILVSIERINDARTVNVWIGQGSFWPNFIIDPIPIRWSTNALCVNTGNIPCYEE